MGAYGHPGSSGQAQSGGINKTFGGGKGGTAQTKGTTQGRKIGSGRLNNGLGYNVRTEGGDKTMTGFKGTAGKTPPLSGGKSATKTKNVKVRQPNRGGSK